MQQKVLCFDIETIPDIENAQKIYEITDLNEQDAWAIIKSKRLEKSGNDFMPHYLHKIIAISLVLQDSQQFKVWTIGNDGETEAEIISRFFMGLEKYQPTLVSWNGQGFDLPVLHYRALLHRIQAPIYWEMGEHFSEFKWNNYSNRFHQRHIDLMDTLSGFQNKAFAPLDELAQILGLPGKIGLHGSEVFPAYQEGKLQLICDYCESDVLNTCFLYFRFLWMKGSITAKQYHNYLLAAEEYIKQNPQKQHWQMFNNYLIDEQKNITR